MNKDNLAIAKDVAQRVKDRLRHTHRNHYVNATDADIVRLGPVEYEAVCAICDQYGLARQILGLEIRRNERPGVCVGSKYRNRPNR